MEKKISLVQWIIIALLIVCAVGILSLGLQKSREVRAKEQREEQADLWLKKQMENERKAAEALNGKSTNESEKK